MITDGQYVGIANKVAPQSWRNATKLNPVHSFHFSRSTEVLNSSSRTRPQTHFICDSLLCVQHRFYLFTQIYKPFVLLCSPILPTAFLLSVITHHGLYFHPVTQKFLDTRWQKFTWCVENLQTTAAFRTDDALLLRLVRRELAAGTRRAKVTTTQKIQEMLPVTWCRLIIVPNNLHSIGQQELLHPGVHLHLNCYQPTDPAQKLSKQTSLSTAYQRSSHGSGHQLPESECITDSQPHLELQHFLYGEKSQWVPLHPQGACRTRAESSVMRIR